MKNLLVGLALGLGELQLRAPVAYQPAERVVSCLVPGHAPSLLPNVSSGDTMTDILSMADVLTEELTYGAAVLLWMGGVVAYVLRRVRR